MIQGGRQGTTSARRTFGARPITRAALLLLIAGVLMAALIGQQRGDRPAAGPTPSRMSGAPVVSLAPKSSPSG
ncbi:MAG TPA: hypothetical protein VI248_02560 [Kineosporiaceae bacterium]